MQPVKVAAEGGALSRRLQFGDGLHWGNVQFKHAFILKEETILSC